MDKTIIEDEFLSEPIKKKISLEISAFYGIHPMPLFVEKRQIGDVYYFTEDTALVRMIVEGFPYLPIVKLLRKWKKFKFIHFIASTYSFIDQYTYYNKYQIPK